MVLISYTSDLTDIFLFESTTSVSAYGGGGAGLGAGIDFAMEGTNAVDKQVGSGGGGAEKGLMYDNTSNFTIGADDHFYVWIIGATPGIADTQANRGIHASIGDSTSAFVKFHVNGSDTLPFGGGNAYAIRFVNTTLANVRTLVGSPGTTPSWIGGGLNVTASAKGVNLGVDGARIGTGYDVTGGTGADPRGTLTGISDDDVTTSEGVFQPTGAGFAQQGKIRIGSSGSACEFEDSNATIVMVDTFHSLSTFNEWLIENSATVLDLTTVTFLGLGTNSPGRLEAITSAATINLTGCVFQDFGDLVFGTGTTALDCSFINTDQITANGADMTGSSISGYEGTADTGILIWNVATDPNGLLDNMSISKGTAATHAIEFGTTSPLTMTLTGIDFTGYNAANAQNDSTFNVLRTSGTVTINISGGSGNVSYKTAGATVVIVQNPVLLQLTATDVTTGNVISGARAYITPSDNTGPFPWEESVTITRVTTTATVSHTAHGMSNGNQVFIEGAVQSEYNGIQTISNVSTNAYDYTVSGSPTTPATGTIIATAILINETTTAGGIADDTRTYTTDQPISGRIRSSSMSTYYKTAPITGTINKDSGLSISVQMIPDE